MHHQGYFGPPLNNYQSFPPQYDNIKMNFSKEMPKKQQSQYSIF